MLPVLVPVLERGKLTPYTAIIFFSAGILAGNFLFNTAIMMKPFAGEPVPMSDRFKGTGRDHLLGIVGGMIWGVFLWKEFRKATPGTHCLLLLMFAGYVFGLLLIILACKWG
jgi:glucose uptake protein